MNAADVSKSAKCESASAALAKALPKCQRAVESQFDKRRLVRKMEMKVAHVLVYVFVILHNDSIISFMGAKHKMTLN